MGYESRRWIARFSFLLLLLLLLLVFGSGCERKQSAGALASGENPKAAPSTAPDAAVVPGPAPSESAAPAPAADRADQAAFSQGLLWKVTGPKGAAFILGSVHVAKPELYPLRPLIEQSFTESDALVVEVDTASQAAAAMAMMQAGTYGSGDSLEAHVDAETWKLLQGAAAKAGLPMQLMSSTKPWLAAVMLMAKDISDLGYQPSLGIDVHFMDQARKRKVKIIPLETVEEQIAALANYDEKTQQLMLLETIEESATIGAIMERVTTAWRRGDAKDVEEFLMGTMSQPEYAALYKGLFIDRNIKMTKKLGAMLDKGGVYFVVIGAGHLVGTGSVIDLLGNQSLEVERI